MNKLERVQKLISNYGSYSRRQADKLIEEGRVKVNGKVIELGFKATVNDKIEIDGKQIKFNLKHEYYLLNKPKGYICQRKDKLNKEVISLIDNYKNRNLFTIGRLDVNTTGLIIITSDGQLASEVNLPENNIKKTYLVWVNEPLKKEMIYSLINGTKLDDDYVTKKVHKFKLISNLKNNVLFKITISEGKKNQIKRMLIAHDRKVLNLKRIKIGNHNLDGILSGEYKKLSKKEMYEGLGLNYE